MAGLEDDAVFIGERCIKPLVSQGAVRTRSLDIHACAKEPVTVSFRPYRPSLTTHHPFNLCRLQYLRRLCSWNASRSCKRYVYLSPFFLS